MNNTRHEQDDGKISRDTCNTEICHPKVGIFWFIKTEHKDFVIADAVPCKKGEEYGIAIQYGGHYNFWEVLKPKSEAEKLFKSRSYDAYPRGRVVFFPDTETFRVYLDGCLTVADLTTVLRVFELDFNKFRITFKRDEHYQCAACNQHWVEC
ncbi:MAG: hypothetical protein ABFD08_07780 [Syntrophomonas sp.]